MTENMSHASSPSDFERAHRERINNGWNLQPTQLATFLTPYKEETDKGNVTGSPRTVKYTKNDQESYVFYEGDFEDLTEFYSEVATVREENLIDDSLV